MRLGVFGGTFDPPHVGHLIIAEAARDQLGLDRVLWMPVARPPHKAYGAVASAAQRAEMVAMTVAGNPAFELSRIDLDRPGPHFTVDALAMLGESYPDAGLTLILGLDSLLALDTWKHPERLIRLADLAVAGRGAPGGSATLPPIEGLEERIHWVQAPLIDLASHQIRELARQGCSLRYLLTPEVLHYLEAHALYRDS